MSPDSPDNRCSRTFYFSILGPERSQGQKNRRRPWGDRPINPSGNRDDLHGNRAPRVRQQRHLPHVLQDVPLHHILRGKLFCTPVTSDHAMVGSKIL